MNNFTELTVKFENGDELTLVLAEQSFAKFKPAKLYTLTYGEKIEDPVDWENKGSTGVYFNATGTEYFPETAKDAAISAFLHRMRNDKPHIEACMGFRLEDILEKCEPKDEFSLGNLVRAKLGV